MKVLEGVNVLISGAASSVGSALLREFARGGASLLAADSEEEALERALAQLDEPDEVFGHVLEGGDIVSWWDLANLIAAYLPSLNVFVHVAGPLEAVPVRTLSIEAMRAAQEATTDSFRTAIARLEKYFVHASEEDEIGACVVAVVPSTEEDSVPGSLCLAASAKLAGSLTDAYQAEGLNIRVHAIAANPDEPASVVSALSQLLGQ